MVARGRKGSSGNQNLISDPAAQSDVASKVFPTYHLRLFQNLVTLTPPGGGANNTQPVAPSGGRAMNEPPIE